MNKLGIYGTLTFDMNKIDNEYAPVHFDTPWPDRIKMVEDRTHERILIQIEMDGHVAQLRISSNGIVGVSLGGYHNMDAVLVGLVHGSYENKFVCGGALMQTGKIVKTSYGEFPEYMCMGCGKLLGAIAAVGQTITTELYEKRKQEGWKGYQ